MSDAPQSAINSWSGCLDLLKSAESAFDLTWNQADPQLRAEFHKQLLMNVSLAYFIYFQCDADHPDFIPIFNSVFMLQPNPDDTYLYAPLRGDCNYRLWGDRGTIYILKFIIGLRFLSVEDTPGPGLDQHDVDELQIDADGRFEVLLSAERPAGHSGNWWRLDPRAEYLFIHVRSYDWGVEQDARLAIERLGVAPAKARLEAHEIYRNIERVAGFTERLCRMFFEWQNEVRASGYVNQVRTTGFNEWGGIRDQDYWHCVFEFDAGEALILETEIPRKLRYWNVQLNDPLFNAIDFVYRQSTLNGHTASVDADGRFRAVISIEDPGVANWLDTGGYRQGTIIGRWLEADSHPTPTITRVALSDIANHLPTHSLRISAEERERRLRQRIVGGQLRRRW